MIGDYMKQFIYYVVDSFGTSFGSPTCNYECALIMLNQAYKYYPWRNWKIKEYWQ